MAILTPSSSPVFVNQLRQLAQDDGGRPDLALDQVDRTNQILLDNMVAMGGGHILIGEGVPAAACEAGSIYIRTNGTGPAEVLYVNHDGDAGSWYALTPIIP